MQLNIGRKFTNVTIVEEKVNDADVILLIITIWNLVHQNISLWI